MTKKTSTPKTRLTADHRKEVIRELLGLPSKDGPRFHLGASARGVSRMFSRGDVHELVVATVGDVAASDFVFTHFYGPPEEIQQSAAEAAIAPSEVGAVHWSDKTYRWMVISQRPRKPSRFRGVCPGAVRVLSRDEVIKPTVKTVSDVALRDLVFTDFYSLPKEAQDNVQASSAAPSEIRAVHWSGKTYKWMVIS